MNSLPVETLEQIFKLAASEIWPDASNDPISCSIFRDSFKILVQHVASQTALLLFLRVCRRWYDVGMPLLYSWIVVRRDWADETMTTLLATLEHGNATASTKPGKHVLRLSIFPDNRFLDLDIMSACSPRHMSRLFAVCSNVIGVHVDLEPSAPYFDSNIPRMLKPNSLRSLSIPTHCYGQDDNCPEDVYDEVLCSYDQLRALSLVGGCKYHSPPLNHLSISNIARPRLIRSFSLTVSPQRVESICHVPECFRQLQQLTVDNQVSCQHLLDLLIHLVNAVGGDLVSLRMDDAETSVLLTEAESICPNLTEVVWCTNDDLQVDQQVVRAISRRNRNSHTSMQPIVRIGICGVVHCQSADLDVATLQDFRDNFELLFTLADTPRVEEIVLLNEGKPTYSDFERWRANYSGDDFALLHQFYVTQRTDALQGPSDDCLADMLYHGRELLSGIKFGNNLWHLWNHTGVSILNYHGDPLSEHANYTDRGLARYRERVMEIRRAAVAEMEGG